MTLTPPASREIRVFLSSTFRDMDQERDYLLTYIFPVFRAVCLERLVTFTEIDLRWGVTEEDAKNGRTVEICLDEIERCRKIQPPPFFIGFLGERYGWIPTHDDLANYWDIHADSPYAERIQKALEEGISVTELEMRVAFFDPGITEKASRGRFFLRAPSLTDSIAVKAGKGRDDLAFYDPAGGQLARLKDTLRATPFLGLDGYTEIAQFGNAVMAFLMEQLNHYFPADVTPTVETRISASHARYAQSRLHAYVPRPETEQAVMVAWRAARKRLNAVPILISAPSGQGKSAFIAYLASRFLGQDDAVVFAHYVGADGFCAVTAWRDRLIAFLQETGHLTSSISTEDTERWDILPVLLAEAVTGLGKPLVLLLDALNQFSGTQEALTRLAALLLPKGVVLIASATPDVRLSGAEIIELPAFDVSTREQAIAMFLATYRKKFPSELIPLIASNEACATPLYLRMVLEELRLHARFETLEQKTYELLKFTDTGTLFLHILQTMDRVDFADDGHPHLAIRAAGYIAASWRGLRHGDLASLLALESDPISPFNGKNRLSDFILAPLLARFSSFCAYDEGRITLMHSILQKTLLAQKQVSSEFRRDLVNYFNEYHDVESVVERLFQLELLNDPDGIVNNLAPENIYDLWQKYPSMLDRSFSYLDAGNITKNNYVEYLTDKWKNFNKNILLDKRTAELIDWLKNKNYLFLSLSISKQFIELFDENSNGTNLIRRSLALISTSQIYEKLCMFNDAVSCASQAAINLNVFFTDVPSMSAKTTMESGRLMKNRGAFSAAEYHLFMAARDSLRDPLNSYLSIEKILRLTAELYIEQERLEPAEKLFMGLLKFWKQKKDKYISFQEVEFSIDLSLFYKGQRLYDHAIETLLKLKEKLDKNMLYYSSNNYLANIYLSLLYIETRDYFGANENLFKAKSIADEIFHENHPDWSKYFLAKAVLRESEIRFEESSQYFKKAIKNLQISLPWNHIETAKTLLLYARFLNKIGDDASYEKVLHKSYVIMNNSIYWMHPLLKEVSDMIIDFYKKTKNKTQYQIFVDEQSRNKNPLVFEGFHGPFPPKDWHEILQNTNVIDCALKTLLDSGSIVRT